MKKYSIPLVFVFFSMIACPTFLFAEAIQGTSAHAWPSSRTSSNQPYLCVDGNTNTYTWVTAAWYSGLNHIGLDLGGVYPIYQIRLWKDNYDGYNPGPGHADPPHTKNLVIQFTTDSGNMADRNWENVSNLTNGYLGLELMVATAVNVDGTVELDVHDSVNEGHGWASLSFDLVEATGIRITFTTPTDFLNHYKLHEFQVHYLDPAAIIADPENQPELVTTGLLSAAPNPFNPSTTISLAIKDAGQVSVDVFDIRGRCVRSLLDEFCEPTAKMEVSWNGRNDAGKRVASGAYFVKVRSYGSDHRALKIMLME